jgi:hypothetical protein
VVESGRSLSCDWETDVDKRIYEDLVCCLCEGKLAVWPGGGGHTRQATVECHHEKPHDKWFQNLCCVVCLPLEDEVWKQVH